MLKLEFWEDEDKKEDGYQYHCCGVDDSECKGTLNIWHREANYEIAKEKMLENLKNFVTILIILSNRKKNVN